MAILAKAAIILAMLLMPLGLFLAVEGSYFYGLTSQNGINSLIDASVNDMFTSQISQFQSQCQQLNLSCSSLSDLENSLCPKVTQLRASADNNASLLCSNLNLTCSNVSEAELKVCSSLGSSSEICKQFNTISAQLNQAQDTCDQLKSYRAQIDKTKQEAYSKEMPEMGNLSLSKINSMLANSSIIGIIILLASIVITYVASKSIMTVSKSLSFTLLTTGLTMLAIGYFGFSMMNSMLTTQLGDTGVMDKLPSLMNFVNGIFNYQTYIGQILTVLGVLGFVGTFALGKYYFKPETKKK